MYNYNSIYPYNVNYQNQNRYQKKESENTHSPQNSANPQISDNKENQTQNTFPNGTKVAIDYTKGQINISQVLADFRSTIIAINAPDDVADEVSQYLNLVEKESLKENPSKEIVVSNLRNAAKISDDFIAKSLNKPSNVVEGWIKALFMQNINLKSDPDFVNPDFLLNFPKNAQARIDDAKKTKDVQDETVSSKEEENTAVKNESNEIKFSNNDKIEIQNDIELSKTNQPELESGELIEQIPSPFTTRTKSDNEAKEIFTKVKSLPKTPDGYTKALNMLNEALGLISDDIEANENIRAAIHIERGKIFDSYDYVDYALRDYFEATKASELNLKAQAFYKTAQIYDEFNEFDPALSNYLSSVAYSGEADNLKAQTTVLSKIASLYTKQYDIENTTQYQNLALDLAQDSESEALIARTYSNNAQNYQYLGENDKALNGYKNALAFFSRTNESYEEMAFNYEQAAITMEKLGNTAKAAKLQLKANQYYQKAQLGHNQQVIAS